MNTIDYENTNDNNYNPNTNFPSDYQYEHNPSDLHGILHGKLKKLRKKRKKSKYQILEKFKLERETLTHYIRQVNQHNTQAVLRGEKSVDVYELINQDLKKMLAKEVEV